MKVQFARLVEDGGVVSHTGATVPIRLWLLFYDDGTVGWSEAGPLVKGGASGTFPSVVSPAFPEVVQAERRFELSERRKVPDKGKGSRT